MSDNWIVKNIERALETWSDKLAEIWQLLTQSPETFKGGSIWQVMQTIHGALQAIALALLVLFFAAGVVIYFGKELSFSAELYVTLNTDSWNIFH